MALNIYPSFGRKEEVIPTEEVATEKSIYPTVSQPVIPKPVITPVQNPVVPTTPNKNIIQSITAPVPAGLDAGVVLLQRAIRQHESGNRQVLPAEGAELGGASLYQYTKGTWSSVAKKYLGDANAPMSVANENKATYLRIKDWRDKGMKPEQIASMWNAGEGRPNAYAEGMSGVNKYGVKYDVPAYVNRIMSTFKTAAEEYKKLYPESVSGETVKPKESEIYEGNQLKLIKQKISDPETKKLIDSGKVNIGADGSVSLSEDYKKEIKTQYDKIATQRAQLIIKLSGFPGVTDQDLQVVRSAFDKGDQMRLNAAIQRIQIGAQLEGKDKVNFLSWADGITTAVDNLFNKPVLKQFKQLVGLGVGSLAAIENGIINEVGTRISDAVKSVKKGQIPNLITPTSASYKAGIEGIKEGFQFGKQIGEEGAKASIYAPMGVIPNALLSVPQVISGGSKLGTGIETEDAELQKEGALNIGLGIAGALPFYSGKTKSNLLIDRDFFNVAKREVDALRAGVKNVPREIVVSNIFDKKIANEIDSKFDSAIKPSFTGRKTTAMANKYNENKQNAIMSIVDNKDNLKLIKDGEEVVGKLPENVEQLGHSVDQTLSKVFKEYDTLKEQAGDAGIQIDTKNVAEKMLEIVNDPKFKAWEDYNPGTVNYLMDLTARLEKRGTYTPSEAQAMIEELNAGLKAFYRNPNPSDVTKTAINASLAGELRKSMDDAITGATGEGYQALRNKYAQLKTIQDDINRAVNRMANAPARGLVDSLTSPFASADILMGLVSGNPAQIVRGGSFQVLRNIYKKISNPDFRIKKMFNNIENLLKEREARMKGTTLTEKAAKIKPGLNIEDVSKKSVSGYHISRDEQFAKQIRKSGFSLENFGKSSGSSGDPKGIYFFPENSRIPNEWMSEATQLNTFKNVLDIKNPYRPINVQDYLKNVVEPALGTQYKSLDELRLKATPKDSQKITDFLKSQGFDSIIDEKGILSFKEPQIVVFDPKQINKNLEQDIKFWTDEQKNSYQYTDIAPKGSQKIKPEKESYFYHITSDKNIESIKKIGLDPKKSGGETHFNGVAAQTYDDEVLLRVKQSSIDAQESAIAPEENFFTTTGKVKPENLEIKIKGKWQDLTPKKPTLPKSTELKVTELEKKQKEHTKTWLSRWIQGEDLQHNPPITTYKYLDKSEYKPSGPIKVYKAIEKGEEKAILSEQKKQFSSWTSSKNVAERFGKDSYSEYKIIEKTVTPDEVFVDLNKVPSNLKKEGYAFHGGSPKEKEIILKPTKDLNLTKTEFDKDFKVEIKKTANKEQIVKNIQAKQIIDKSKPTTKILNELNGKPTVKRQFIEDLLKKPEIKQVEKDIITKALKTEGDIIDSKLFAQKVQNELLPLKRVTVGGESDGVTIMPKYKSVALPDDLRGNVDKYTEHIYESPIKTSAGDVHFKNQTENYFGHTRVEDMADGKIRRVIENQTDLYQRGRLADEIESVKAESSWNNRLKDEDYLENLKTQPEKHTYSVLENKEEIKGVIEDLKSDLEDAIYEGNKMQANIIRQRIKLVKETNRLYFPGLSKTVSKNINKRSLELQKLSQYNDPTAHYRMVREEVKQAAIDGKTKLQFPTGETAMKIEGLGDTTQWSFRDDMLYNRKLTADKLKVGQEIQQGAGNELLQRNNLDNRGSWIITDVLEDGKFKAVPKDWLETEYKGKSGLENVADYFKETFDISGKIDTNNPIYKFYEKDLGKYLKNRYGATEITDKSGVKWYEVDINPKMKNEPVLAFGHTDIKTLLSTGAILTAGGLVAALVKEKKQNSITNQTEPKSTVAATTTPETLSMPVFSENRIPKLDGVPLNEIKLSKETPETINKITITHGNQNWTVEKPKELEIANRIKFITDQIKPEWTNYLLKLANFEGVYNQKQRNYNYKRGEEKGISSRTKRQDLIDAGYSESVDRGIFQINNKAFPQITDQMADNLDFSILWAISLIDAGKQDKWAADKYGLVKPAKIKVE